MNKIFFVSLIFFFSFRILSQTITYENDTVFCKYTLENGRLNGKYQSFYKNGIKKSEGDFENNYRIGEWSLWDTAGVLLVKRDYKNPFVYDLIFPKLADEPPIKLLNKPVYEINYNKDNYIDFFNLTQREILWRKTFYKKVTIKNNKLIFNSNILYNIIKINLLNDNIKAETGYYSDKYFLIDSLNLKENISSFVICEVIFFDLDRLVLESRIIFIIIENKNGRKLWIPFKDSRKYFAKEKLNSDNLPDKIKTLDDLFFYRYYTGEYVEIDFDKNNKYKEQIENKDIYIIEKEHELWRYIY